MRWLWLGALVVACSGGNDTDPPACNPVEEACACGAEVCEVGQQCDEGRCVSPLPAAVCTDGTRYSPGTATFAEVTSAWGLDGVRGLRLNATDIDGDGWTDLVVRQSVGGLDRFDGDERRTWLLRNREGVFEDVTQSSGILTPRGSEAIGRPVELAAFADVDNDGDLDAYLAVNTVDADAMGGERSEIMLNDGSGRFVLGPESEIRSPDRVDAPAGAAFTDFDRDGFVDLFVAQTVWTASSLVHMQDRLYRGDGTGRFVEVTADVGLQTVNWLRDDELNAAMGHSWAWSALARDLNGDGIPELLATSYARAPNHLWQGVDEGAGTSFLNRSVESGYAFDDNQMWQDNQQARCFCQANPAADGCEGLPPSLLRCDGTGWLHGRDRQPRRNGGLSSATSAGDLDNDGDLDLFTGEIRHWWAGLGADGSEVLVNDGELRFTRPGDDAMGLAIDHPENSSWDEGHMNHALFDFDNDGRLDIYISASEYPGNRGFLYHQTAPMMFAEVPTTDFFEHNRSHGVAVGDFDHDEDLDVIVAHSRSRCDESAPNNCYPTTQIRAFENRSAPGNWIQLRLEGAEGTNGAAIGAQVTARYGDLVQVLEVDGGHGHFGAQSDPTLHVGLGSACEVEITVRWPSRDLPTETYTLPAGHRFILRQDQQPQTND
ncbi:MAG: CRTAC1 family protein [Myxococcota bacterium]